ncbi:MAG: M1 family metallopeptidase [Chitinophagales bacterium]
MKFFFLLILEFSLSQFGSAQESVKDSVQPSLDQFVGLYYAQLDSSSKFIIQKEKDHLMLVVPEQGSAPMDWITGNQFRPKYVKPVARVEFIRDSLGQFGRMLWMQDIQIEWIPVDQDQSINNTVNNSLLSEYEGKFKLKSSPSTIAIVKEEAGLLTIQVVGQGKLQLTFLSQDRFAIQNDHLMQLYQFRRNGKNRIEKIIMTRTGAIDFLKSKDSSLAIAMAQKVSNRQNGFNAGDSLRGMLNSMRTCYDVLFYSLDVQILPDTKSIRGHNLIRFKTMEPFKKMQVDLYANMKIDSILFHKKELAWSRAYDAVFIQFPETIPFGSKEEITIYYEGKPQVPNLSIPMHGGFLWYQNNENKLWIESVVQGSGASLWWPCKDHLSDKPDSMKISVTVPSELTDISNGRLISKTEIPGKLTKFDWYVSYPINNYDVAVNIGDYVHFTDSYVRHGDSLSLDYYCMPYNVKRAKEIFGQAKAMIAIYENKFGRYPFERDGFVLMESIYPMEHQSAVSIGQIPQKHFDAAEMRRLMWHESAHEWWGNSLTCKDMADFWIHESFATYSEYLNIENISGRDPATKAINKQISADKDTLNGDPIIGIYDVNDIHRDLGALYSKGSLMLNTLRNIINNDTVWFGILLGLQEQFRYKTVTTEDITKYINEKTKTNYDYFFDQYLRHPGLPELEIKLINENSSLSLQYKWNADVKDFRMPVKVTMSKNNFEFIRPTTSWQTLNLGNLDPADFRIARDEFYIRVRNVGTDGKK